MLGSMILGASTLGESETVSAPKLVASYGTITVTVQAVCFVRDAKIDAVVGDFTLTGFTVTNVNIAGVGNFTLSGESIAIKRTYHSLQAGVGGFSYDGGAVTMERRTSKPYPARPGSTGRPLFRATGFSTGIRARAVSGD